MNKRGGEKREMKERKQKNVKANTKVEKEDPVKRKSVYTTAEM